MNTAVAKRKPPNTSSIAAVGKMTKLVKAIKAVKVLKPMLTVATAGLSVVAYSLSLGIYVAVGLVVMLFIHEMGHVFALRKRGKKASAPVFIPFLGAAIFAPDLGDRHEEAYVGYGGPLLGGLAAIGLLGVVVAIPASTALRVIAYIAVYINLFNLLPIRPLDGGRIMQATGDNYKRFGVVALLVATLLLQAPGLLLIWILVVVESGISMVRKAVAIIIIYATMMTLTLLGVGQEESTVFIIIDALVGVLILVVVILPIIADLKTGNKRYTEPTAQVNRDTRPHLSRTRKLQWGSAYAAIAVTLGLAFVLATDQLPNIHHHKTTRHRVSER